jgi:hypothetical protein
LIDPLEVQYRELKELRERVRKAEAAAAQRSVDAAGNENSPRNS